MTGIICLSFLEILVFMKGNKYRMKNEFLRFFKKYGFNSILVRNSISLFLIFIVIMIVPIFIAGKLGLSNVRKEAINANKDIFQRINSSIELIFRDVIYLSAEIFVNSEVGVYMTSKDVEYLENNYEQHLADTLKVAVTGESSIDSIYLYSPSKNLICTEEGFFYEGDFYDTAWIEYCDDLNSDNYVIIPRMMVSYYCNAFTFIKKDPNFNGYIVININMDSVKKKVLNFADDDLLFCIVRDNSVIYSNKSNVSDVVFDTVLENTDKEMVRIDKVLYSVFNIKSDFYDWSYINAKTCDEYENSLKNIYFIIILVLLFAILVAIMISIKLSATRMDEIVVLTDIVENRKTDGIGKENEISAIANRIIRIVDDNSTLMEELRKRIKEYNVLRIKALQAQINSHFLNNTLSVINKEIIKNEGYGTSAGKMVVDLSKILRYSFIVEDNLVTLEEEKNFIEKYLKLMQIRYGNFTYIIDIPDDLLKFKVPRMLLQVLCENSVFYGLKNGGNIISVRSFVENDFVNIIVEDNGLGMDYKTLEKITKSFESDKFADKNIGICNVYSRLKLIYGDNADLQIYSEENKFTKILILIPKE